MVVAPFGGGWSHARQGRACRPFRRCLRPAPAWNGQIAMIRLAIDAFVMSRPHVPLDRKRHNRLWQGRGSLLLGVETSALLLCFCFFFCLTLGVIDMCSPQRRLSPTT